MYQGNNFNEVVLRVLAKRFIGIFLMAMKPVVSNIGYYDLLHLLHTLSSIC